MSDETPTEPLGEPEAMDPDELDDQPSTKGNHGESIFGALFAGVIGSVVLLGMFPACTAGATGSTRLRWKDRNAEITALVRAQDEIEKGNKNESANPD